MAQAELLLRFPFFWKKVLTNEWVNDIINEFCSREQQQNKFLKKLKKVVDIEKNLWYDIKVACDGVEKERKKLLERKLKKFLTKSKQHDKISKLSETAKNIDNWTVKHIPRKFF